jgi:hypothetical protein
LVLVVGTWDSSEFGQVAVEAVELGVLLGGDALCDDLGGGLQVELGASSRVEAAEVADP